MIRPELKKFVSFETVGKELEQLTTLLTVILETCLENAAPEKLANPDSMLKFQNLLATSIHLSWDIQKTLNQAVQNSKQPKIA